LAVLGVGLQLGANLVDRAQIDLRIASQRAVVARLRQDDAEKLRGFDRGRINLPIFYGLVGGHEDLLVQQNLATRHYERIPT